MFIGTIILFSVSLNKLSLIDWLIDYSFIVTLLFFYLSGYAYIPPFNHPDIWYVLIIYFMYK